jgi:hypothetical protein
MPSFALQTSIGLIALLAASVAPAASIRFEEFGPFLVRSTAEGQLSSEMQELRANTLAELQVKYVAPAEHCSAVQIHYLLDGMERGVSGPVSPGKSSGYFDFGVVPAGEHIVALRAEGRPGGCNGGRLTSWGGSALVRTTVETDAGLDARAASFGSVIFYAASVNYSWGRRRQGIYVTADGDVYAFLYEPAQREWNPAPDAKGRIAVFDLQERFSHHPRWLLKLDERELKTRQAALASIQDAPHPTTSQGVRYDGGAEFLGAYRLDTASGSYVDVPICTRGGRLEEPQSRDASGLCNWLDSLLRLSYQPTTLEEK